MATPYKTLLSFENFWITATSPKLWQKLVTWLIWPSSIHFWNCSHVTSWWKPSINLLHLHQLYCSSSIEKGAWGFYTTVVQTRSIKPRKNSETPTEFLSRLQQESRIFLGFICNCLSYFITTRITFTCISTVHSYDLYHIHIMSCCCY